MSEKFQINDMAVKELTWRDGVLTVVEETDPLLRRFGQLDHVLLAGGEEIVFERRQADEIWAVVTGVVEFTLVDRREDSPSYQASQTLVLDSSKPQAVLVPFGVRCRMVGKIDAGLLRLSSHQDTTDAEDLIP